MKKQTLAILRWSHTGKLVIVAIFLSGLLGIIPLLARAQDQSEVATATKAAGPSGVVSSPLNPLQVAMMRWYGANLTTQFTAGTNPFGVAFDGANIWVTTEMGGIGVVTKLRVRTAPS